MAKSEKKPGGKFLGLRVLFTILAVLLIGPALLELFIGGNVLLREFGFKNEITALPSFDVLQSGDFYTADLSSIIKYGEVNRAIEVTGQTIKQEYYYIKSQDLSNDFRYMPVIITHPDSMPTGKIISDANQNGEKLPAGTELKITGRLETRKSDPAMQAALLESMIAANIVTDEDEMNDLLLPFQLVEMPLSDYIIAASIGGGLLLLSILFFILGGVMAKKRRKLIEEYEIKEAAKVDFSKIKQPNSEKFFSTGDDIDSLVAVTPTAPKREEKDDGTYKPKLPTPTAQAEPDDLDLSNLDFSSLKPPDEEDPLF
jgi:hypothetical protein